MEHQKYTISTNKLLYELFNYTFEDEEIKEAQEYDKVSNTIVVTYYKEFDYISSKNNTFRVRISSFDKDNLKFTIYEKMLYFMLISNARQSSDDNYFISMRKLRNIRGLKDDSLSTYKCYENAIKGLTNKMIRLIPMKSNHGSKIIKCNLLSITNIVENKSRISEFNYSFNGLDATFVRNKQKITIFYNPFAFIFKKNYSFQIYLHLIRLVALNKNEDYEKKEFSFQLILKQIRRVNKDGVIENINYYDYIATSANKQSERLNKCYEELEIILKHFVKCNIIKSFSISKKRTFKYLRDDEVKITIKFIK